MTVIDLSTSTGALRFCERRRAEMVRCFERLGRFEENGSSFAAYAFLTHEVMRGGDARDPNSWRTGPKLARVTVEPLRMPSLLARLLPEMQQTLIFGEALRRYCALGRAVGCVIMHEIWTAESEATGTDWQSARDELPERLEDYPDRGEALALRLEHRATGARTWHATIRRTPTRLEPWHELNLAAVGGRLVNIVAPKEWAS